VANKSRKALQLNRSYKSIQEDLLKVEARLKEVSRVDFSEQSKLIEHSLKGGGKRIRPALTLLAGKFYDYDPQLLLPMATAVELMHVATLVHDDKSPVRRGRPTINKLWGEDKAVLVGDYLFAKAGEVTATTQNSRVTKLFAQTLMIISSGELIQSFNAFNLEQTREHYLRRISYKTASLLSLATEAGAILSQAPEESIRVLKDYGYNLGIAFQIVDDILDFVGTEAEIGKPTGSDLAQGTLTLPAMLLLERYPQDNPVKRLFHNEDKQKNIKLAMELVGNSSITQECYAIASDYCSIACRDLNLLPDKPSRQALAELADYVVDRRK
jgi:geranylgeranyl pyrophosphate synthase